MRFKSSAVVLVLRHPLTGLGLSCVMGYGLYSLRKKKVKRHKQCMWIVYLGSILTAIDGHWTLKSWNNRLNWKSAHFISSSLLLVAMTGQIFLTEYGKSLHRVIGTTIAVGFCIHVLTGTKLLLDL
jgi:uncharacterized membrane protein